MQPPCRVFFEWGPSPNQKRPCTPPIGRGCGPRRALGERCPPRALAAFRLRPLGPQTTGRQVPRGAFFIFSFIIFRLPAARRVGYIVLKLIDIVLGPTLSEQSIRTTAGPLGAMLKEKTMRPVYSRPSVGPSLLAAGAPALLRRASPLFVGSERGVVGGVGVPPWARIPRPRRGLEITLVYLGTFWGFRPKPRQPIHESI